TDVTDVSPSEEGRRKREEGRRKREEGRGKREDWARYQAEPGNAGAEALPLFIPQLLERGVWQI
ncbi:hypothetical protein QT970_25640, partial [Microcoleus sp. herbarium8]|uniref:hypothetical protein n=1 Tax=Microcoleus sp. herbarium8 TaxID=3055436 RepID=UPI002FD6838B